DRTWSSSPVTRSDERKRRSWDVAKGLGGPRDLRSPTGSTARPESPRGELALPAPGMWNRMTASSESVEAPAVSGDFTHDPVMVDEVLEALACAPGGVYVDCTLGLGGHAAAILERIQPGGLLLGVDRDRDSLEQARTRLAGSGDSMRFAHDNF